jgi:divalent metal cation (Fe/Co/Zn/Cd) transporter
MEQTLSTEQARSAALRRLANMLSLTTAVALVAVKLAAWIMTGSAAMLTLTVDVLWVGGELWSGPPG